MKSEYAVPIRMINVDLTIIGSLDGRTKECLPFFTCENVSTIFSPQEYRNTNESESGGKRNVLRKSTAPMTVVIENFLSCCREV